MDNFGEIQNIIAATLGVPPISIHPDSQASDLPAWDSLRHLLLIMEIEQKFNVKFSLTEIATLDSVVKIAEALQKRASLR